MHEKDLALLMLEQLKKKSNQSRISVKDLLNKVAPQAENVDCALLFRLLSQEAEKYQIVLETPIQNRYEEEEYYKHKFTVYHRKPGPPCPKCSSRFTAKVHFGATRPNNAEQAQIDAKEVVWGGCCESEHPESYFCLHCHKSFGRLYHTRAIHSLILDRETGRIAVFATPHGAEVQMNDVTVATLDQKEWAAMVRRLLNDCYILDWRPTYINKVAPVGNLWRVEVEVTEEKTRKYRGWNAFPPYWDNFVRVIADLLAAGK